MLLSQGSFEGLMSRAGQGWGWKARRHGMWLCWEQTLPSSLCLDFWASSSIMSLSNSPVHLLRCGHGAPWGFLSWHIDYPHLLLENLQQVLLAPHSKARLHLGLRDSILMPIFAPLLPHASFFPNPHNLARLLGRLLPTKVFCLSTLMMLKVTRRGPPCNRGQSAIMC